MHEACFKLLHRWLFVGTQGGKKRLLKVLSNDLHYVACLHQDSISCLRNDNAAWRALCLPHMLPLTSTSTNCYNSHCTSFLYSAPLPLRHTHVHSAVQLENAQASCSTSLPLAQGSAVSVRMQDSRLPGFALGPSISNPSVLNKVSRDFSACVCAIVAGVRLNSNDCKTWTRKALSSA